MAALAQRGTREFKWVGRTFTASSSIVNTLRSIRLKQGCYVLEVQTDPDHSLPEENYANNYGAVLFDFAPARGNHPAQVTILPGP